LRPRNNNNINPRQSLKKVEGLMSTRTITSIHGGLFQLGEVRITRAAYDVLASVGMNAVPLLVRHATGDWGCVPQRLRKRNQRACSNFEQVESWHLVQGRKVAIVTDGERTMTTICLPHEMEEATEPEVAA
jgi:hypothetical protein